MVQLLKLTSTRQQRASWIRKQFEYWFGMANETAEMFILGTSDVGKHCFGNEWRVTSRECSVLGQLVQNIQMLGRIMAIFSEFIAFCGR